MAMGDGARGPAGHRVTGAGSGAFDVKFTYDFAERLTALDDTNGAPVKRFTFATGNDAAASDWRQGKLLSAVRHNYLPSGDVTVTERRLVEECG